MGAHCAVLFRCLTFKNLFCIVKVASGAVAQLGERLNGIQEVVGSIPIGSTKILQSKILEPWIVSSQRS